MKILTLTLAIFSSLQAFAGSSRVASNVNFNDLDGTVAEYVLFATYEKLWTKVERQALPSILVCDQGGIVIKGLNEEQPLKTDSASTNAISSYEIKTTVYSDKHKNTIQFNFNDAEEVGALVVLNSDLEKLSRKLVAEIPAKSIGGLVYSKWDVGISNVTCKLK